MSEKPKGGTFVADVAFGSDHWVYQSAFDWKGHRFVVHWIETYRGYKVSHEASGKGVPTVAQNTQKAAKAAAVAKLEEKPRRSLRILRDAVAQRTRG